ncbi:DNA polymerase IV [Nocardioides lentus]|uniref:DNA polymerase IV n=1 Tax=Nocardioides lentus TaxID=338077 RepID=A0ABP5AAW2_9ACTN
MADAAVGEATILHADLDAFYASVEQRDDPRLRGRPVIVGGGVVLAASYEARRAGVRTAMGGREALRLCPEALVVPARMDAYSAASAEVFAVFRDVTPMVEPVSIDEAFLEVGGLRRSVGSPVAVAQRLRRRVHEEAGLAVSVGVARTKFLAKVASGSAKPDGLLLVPPDGEDAFLRPMRVERLWGVGEKTATKLHRLGIDTVGDVVAMDEAALAGIVGPAAARHLHALARHQDPRPVDGGPARRSIGSQRALGRRRRSPEELDVILSTIVDRLAHRLRAGDRDAGTVVLRLRYGDFTRATRSHTLVVPTRRTTALLDVARGLLVAEEEQITVRGLTLLGVSFGNLARGAGEQLELALDDRAADRDPGRRRPAADPARRDERGPRRAELDSALDAVRDRYGQASVARATQLGRDHGQSSPVLPEHE